MLQADSFTILFFIGSVSVAGWILLRVWSEVAGLLRMDWLEGGFLAAVSLIICIGWIGVILASLGVFSLTAIALIVLLVSVGVLLWRRPMKEPLFARLTRAETVLLILLLVCAAVYFRPHEYVFGGQDVGTYVNIGATIARTGKFVLHEPWVEFLSAHSAVTLREQPANFLTRKLQFVGWYIDDGIPGRVIPQFFPFHPTLIAVGMQLAGLYGGLLVTPLWGVLGLAAVYLVTRRLLNAKTALLAVFLLAVTPTQVYFSRYSTTEPLTLLLVFAGLLAFQVLWDTGFRSRAWGMFFGGVFGAAFLTRIDLVVVFGCAILFLMFAWLLGYRRPGWWAAALSFGVLSVYATVSALVLNWPYVWNTYGAVLRLLKNQPVFIGGAALIVLGGVVGIFLLRNRSSNRAKRLGDFVSLRWISRGLVVAALALSAYAYFLRPLIEPTHAYPHWLSGNPVASLDALNWVRIGWYVTPLGLLLATVGLAGIFRKHLELRWGFFLSVGVLTTLQYVYKAFIPSYHIYMMRRYVPIVLPMLMIYAASAVNVLLDNRARVLKSLGILTSLGLTIGLLYQGRNVGLYRDYVGAVEQISGLNMHLKSDAIVIINEPLTSLFSDYFGAPLHFIFGHDIATVYKDDEQAATFVKAVIDYADKERRPVQLIAVSPVASALRGALDFLPVEMSLVSLYTLEHTFEHYPSSILNPQWAIEIYDVYEKSIEANETLRPLEIDIGSLDSAFIGDGFYGREVILDAPSMRWTTDKATVEIPLIAPTSVTIEVRAMIYHPDGVLPSEVRIELDDREIGRFTLSEEWQVFAFNGQALPTNGLSKLLFETTPFNPASLNVNNDTRDLGFLIDWIKITPNNF